MLRRSSAPSDDDSGTEIYKVLNGRFSPSTEPRSLNPQADSMTVEASARQRRRRFFSMGESCQSKTSCNDVDQLAGHDDDFLRCALDELLYRFVGQRGRFDGRLVGILGDDHAAAQLAVHLHHQLDLGLFQRGGIDLRPWRIE